MIDFDIWSEAASIRRDQIESGTDTTFLKVFAPLYLELLRKIQPKNSIEIGAGTGHLAKVLSSYSKKILALEPSEKMFEVAKKTLENTTNVTLIKKSSSDFKTHLLFDLAYSHMCLHTIEDGVGFLSSIKEFLHHDSKFILTIPHPCFYNKYKKYFKRNFDYNLPTKKNVALFISSDPSRIIENIPYYHRPLSFYINTLSATGFIIEELIEIIPDKETQKMYSPSWKDPRYCMFIVRADNRI